MDKLDVSILRSLEQGMMGYPFPTDFRKSIRTVARNLNVDELTVRNRLLKLRESGFLRGWRLLVNPNLSGVNVAQLLVETDASSKDDLIEKFRRFPNTVVIVVHLGNSAYLVLADDVKGLNQQSKVIEKLNGETPTSVGVRFPASELKLTRSDLQIISALSADPRMRYSTVARGLGLSTRTVKRRLRRLIDGKALFVVPSTDPSKLEGAMYVDLLIRHSGARAMRLMSQEVISQLDDSLVRAQVGDQRYSFFNLILTRISAISEILKLLKFISGVEDARMDVVQNRLEFYDRYIAQLNRHLGAFPIVGNSTI